MTTHAASLALAALPLSAPAALAVATAYAAGAAALWVYAYVTVARSVRRIEGRLRACPARAGDARREIWRAGR